jgi:hypothetical protein
MFFLSERKTEPTDLKLVNELKISVNEEASESTQTVCLGFNHTLAFVFSNSNKGKVPDEFLDSAIMLDQGMYVIPRPGSGELLRRLNYHAAPMIYSRGLLDDLEAMMLALSIAEGDPDDFESNDEHFEERANAWISIPIWSDEQCVETGEVSIKSLGNLCEHIEGQINHTWLIDYCDKWVDFPTHVVKVPEFYGDPEDKYLYELMGKIFKG